MAQNPAALADSILTAAEPEVARDLVHLTLGSDDPEDHRKFLELMAKRRQKDGPSAGAMFHFTFDMGGFVATEVKNAKPAAEVIDMPEGADDLRPGNPALEAPEKPEPFTMDLDSLLGLPAE